LRYERDTDESKNAKNIEKEFAGHAIAESEKISVVAYTETVQSCTGRPVNVQLRS
jgi:hypothetical protein